MSIKITFEELAVKLVHYPDHHARFVNTLSLLEYIGARKIIKSQQEANITNETLSHAAEEIRHAYALKRLALKMSQGKLKTYSNQDLLGGNQARHYIQAIDNGVAKILGTPADEQLNYLLTTLLLEERANLIYPFYEKIIAKSGYPGVFRSIVKEEEAHLESVNQSLVENKKLTANQFKKLKEMEESEFSQFLEALFRELPCAERSLVNEHFETKTIH